MASSTTDAAAGSRLVQVDALAELGGGGRGNEPAFPALSCE